MRGLDPANTALLSWEDCEQFSELYLPGMSYEEKKQPGLSAAYNNLRQLTSALFLCGTVDPMLDDQFLMAMRWQIAGNEAVVKFVPGACHGFMSMDGKKVLVTKLGWDHAVNYINYRMAATTPSSR
jgi:acetyl esterase/lipase